MRRRISVWPIGGLLMIGAVLTSFPFFWMLTTSLKPIGESYTYPPTVLPSTITLESYLQLFANFDFGRYLVNTVIVVIFGFVGLFFVAMAGYAFAKYRFRGKNPLFLLVLTTMMVPIQVAMIRPILCPIASGPTQPPDGLALPPRYA